MKAGPRFGNRHILIENALHSYSRMLGPGSQKHLTFRKHRVNSHRGGWLLEILNYLPDGGIFPEYQCDFRYRASPNSRYLSGTWMNLFDTENGLNFDIWGGCHSDLCESNICIHYILVYSRYISLLDVPDLKKGTLCQADNTTVEVLELWTVFHERYSLLGQSRIMGCCISTDHRFAYKDCSVCRSSHFYEAVYFCHFEIQMGISMLSYFSFIFH